MQRLTGIDATFLYLETPSMPMHVGSVAVLDPSKGDGSFSYEKFRSILQSRLHLLPPFRRRLVNTPFSLHHPVWIEDPDFDLDFHIRRSAIPSPGGPEELNAFVGENLGRHLDRARPLWRMWVVEGLEGGRVAVVGKVHHAAIDGVSGAELLATLLDLEVSPAQTPPPKRPWRAERVPTDAEMLSRALVELAPYPLRATKAVRRTVETALNLRSQNKKPDQTPAASPLFKAPKTILNGSITRHRKTATAEVSLEDVKLIRRVFGTTVNDVVLAVCAGALRRYLDSHNDLPDIGLIAAVPISVRTEIQKGAMGNRVSAMFSELATHIDDPVERLMRIHASTLAAKEQHEMVGADALTDWAEFAAPSVFAQAARLYSRLKLADIHSPAANLVVSNVPGPQFPLYMAGAELDAIYPFGPVNEGMGLNMTVMSYRGKVCFGLLACFELLPDLEDLAHELQPALTELVEAAQAHEAKSRAEDSKKVTPIGSKVTKAAAPRAKAAPPRAPKQTKAN